MRRREAGFTLLEITIAVMVLAVSLVTLLGLQASIMEQSVRDRERQSALLVARRVLAAIEASEDPLQVGTREGKVGELLRMFLAGSEEDRSDATDASLNLDAILRVEEFQVPSSDPDNDKPEIMKKAFLKVFWGPSDLDSLELVYLVPDTENQDSDTQEEKNG